ncbi:hypothetical protein [Streptomyces griseus]|uniref:hypothetical protein n=1 Tax=Streptomyces griseus TaxID=1911 RepID=UPI00083FDE30|nr:hypothetical protein [Streptomyces griseus]
MNIVTRTLLVATAALTVLAGAALPAASSTTGPPTAARKSCPVKAWGYRGHYRCGTDLKAGYIDWNRDGRTDEVFVIAPNRHIWHTWKNAGGWKEMPGNGRADDMVGDNGTGSPRRCVIVYVIKKGYRYYQNCHYNGTWHNWTTSG